MRIPRKDLVSGCGTNRNIEQVQEKLQHEFRLVAEVEQTSWRNESDSAGNRRKKTISNIVNCNGKRLQVSGQ